MQILTVFYALLICCTLIFGREYTVIGQLMCGAKFLKDSHIEIRTTSVAGYSFTEKTNGTGQFQVIAGASSFSGDLKQQLIIHHNCDVDVDEFGKKVKESYQRESYMELPPRLAKQKSEVGSLYDIGRLNMQIILPVDEKVQLMRGEDKNFHYRRLNRKEKVKLPASKKSGCTIL